MGVVRILIVEDDFQTADYLNLLLSQNGYLVTDIVGTGEEAVRVALKTKPDLILMDIKLGGVIDGNTACERIKRSIDIPIIFVSAYGEERVIEQAMLCGPSAFIVKPSKSKTLITDIEKALSNMSLNNGVNNATIKHFTKPN